MSMHEYRCFYTRARAIKRTLGTYVAARYLAKRGISLEGALAILAVNKKG